MRLRPEARQDELVGASHKDEEMAPARSGSRAGDFRKLLEEWVARRNDLAETEGGGARSPRTENLAAAWRIELLRRVRASGSEEEEEEQKGEIVKLVEAADPASLTFFPQREAQTDRTIAPDDKKRKAADEGDRESESSAKDAMDE
ncbi:hypothetical protein DL764_010395 [Monosporascus ibericus]|uniref:Uncharacterized protein n=1 Tax=Monosporascus ibericus TaxID=155417 RepID=A0A4Q4SVG4_9PEZI|nr:hypothetical protein DL764_010395 [Monosporascus ibericus]